jgi:multidrug transporter EmrE-like cation transporter
MIFMGVKIQKNVSSYRNLLLLHMSFLIYSFSGIFSKLAAQQKIMTNKFIFLYGTAIITLILYSILWQVILQRFSLSTAFANKGIVVGWGILWGNIIFQEELTIGKLVAAVLIITGIIILGRTNE